MNIKKIQPNFDEQIGKSCKKVIQKVEKELNKLTKQAKSKISIKIKK